MPDAELDLPFFERRRTLRMIDELSHLPSMCFYVGAGVTVERTRVGWSSLVTQLLEKAHMSPAAAQAIVTRLGPIAAASIVDQSFREEYEDRAPTLVMQELRSILYKSHDRLAGRLSTMIAELWFALAAMPKPVSVFTTNFDEHLELDFDQVEIIWRDLLRSRNQEIPAVPDAQERIIHLHGLVPELREPLDPARLSEADYFLNRDQTQRLTDAMSSFNILLIGASLQDPALVNVLLETKSLAKSMRLRRVAIIPRSDLGASDSSLQSQEILRANELRLVHLGVEGVYIDHYSQVAQFLAEIRIGLTLARRCERSRKVRSSDHEKCSGNQSIGTASIRLPITA